ncbi:MAG: aminotransferase class III-fold pyridoxal phosphate-dependent enzyme [Planctomycetota bacterium]
MITTPRQTSIPGIAGRRLHDDPRVTRARAYLLEAVADASASLTGPRGPIGEGHEQSYTKTLARFSEQRGGNLFYPFLGSGLGRGPLVELDDGSVKYDMITGIGVHFFGHSHPELVRCAIDAALSDTIMAGNLQQNSDSAALVDEILELANSRGFASPRFAHCFLTSSGAMANENAFKLAFQRHHPADRVLAFEKCFCGRTMVLSQITDKPAYRVGLPPTIAVDYVPGFDSADPEGSGKRAHDALLSHLSRYPGRHAAMKFELVVGEGGFYPGTTEFFRPLMETLNQQNVAVVVDEVQTFGRTPAPFAFQHFGLGNLVDIVSIGKLSQICATLFTGTYKPKPGLLSQTFTGSATAIAAARWVMSQLAGGSLHGPDGRIQRVHNRFVKHFRAIATEHPERLSGPFGLGGMIACTPFGGEPNKVRRLLTRLFDLGVIAFMAGAEPTRLRFLPPVPVVADKDIDAVCGILRLALDDIAQESE